jgi:hypothetical protein
MFYPLLYRFFVGGSILSGSTILANSLSPFLGSILVTLPLELVSLFFIDDKRLQSYSLSILIMSIATVIPVFYFFYIIKYDNVDRTTKIITSFIVWLVVGIALYYLSIPGIF